MKDLEKIFKACGFQNVESKLANDLDKIVEWQKKLQEINIEGIVPMFTTIGDDIKYIYNDDIVNEKQEDLFFNSPKNDDNFFLVPKVIKSS